MRITSLVPSLAVAAALAQAFGGVFGGSSGGTTSGGAVEASNFTATTATGPGLYFPESLECGIRLFGEYLDDDYCVGVGEIGDGLHLGPGTPGGIGDVYIHGALTVDSQLYLNNAAEIGVRNVATSKPVAVTDEDGFRLYPIAATDTMKVCGNDAGGAYTNAAPGVIIVVGADATRAMKVCLCERTTASAYRWRNLLNPADTTGTTTACPASL